MFLHFGVYLTNPWYLHKFWESLNLLYSEEGPHFSFLWVLPVSADGIAQRLCGGKKGSETGLRLFTWVITGSRLAQGGSSVFPRARCFHRDILLTFSFRDARCIWLQLRFITCMFPGPIHSYTPLHCGSLRTVHVGPTRQRSVGHHSSSVFAYPVIHLLTALQKPLILIEHFDEPGNVHVQISYSAPYNDPVVIIPSIQMRKLRHII